MMSKNTFLNAKKTRTTLWLNNTNTGKSDKDNSILVTVGLQQTKVTVLVLEIIMEGVEILDAKH